MHIHIYTKFRTELHGKDWAEPSVVQEAYVTSTACGITQPPGPRVKGVSPLALCSEVLRIGQGKQEEALPTPHFFPLVPASELTAFLPGSTDPTVIKLLKGLKMMSLSDTTSCHWPDVTWECLI